MGPFGLDSIQIGLAYPSKKELRFYERRRKRGEKRKFRDNGDADDGDGAKANGKYKTELTQLKAALQKRNRKIAALKKGKDVSDGSESEGKDDDGVGDDSGDAFGGKREKKRAKTGS